MARRDVGRYTEQMFGPADGVAVCARARKPAMRRNDPKPAPRRRARRKPPRITRGYLTRAIEHYLARYSAPRAHVRRLMMRRVDRSLEAHGGSREEATQLLDEVLERMVELGALDDARYAHSQVESLRRRGMSSLAIRARLGSRGVDSQLVTEHLEAHAEATPDDVDPDLQAACAFVRKRRMGAYRADADERAAMHDKDLGRLARKGFRFDVARRALALETPEEVEALGLQGTSWT